MSAKELLKELTLEEKAALTVGASFWYFESIKRLGLKGVLVTDGPHGIRKQKVIDEFMGAGESVEATCFPPACLSASSWDPELLFKEGEAIAEEAIEYGVDVVLGPGANIKRSPLCGRNFEYFSEDPLLSGKMAASWINGVQSKGVGTSLKHFACNSQEKLRMVSNSVVDERALNEIYLKQFEIAVKESEPWSIMCSYNRINGTYSSDNYYLLTEKLRNEWGFDGLVVTDWGAMNDRAEGIKAGCDVEMPGPNKYNVDYIINEVKEKRLSEEALNKVVLRILELYERASGKKGRKYDREKHHERARKIASSSFVLLKNDEESLPINKDDDIAILGAMAKHPRYQGAGSSQINSNKVDNAYDVLKERGISFEYADGYALKGETSDEILQEAIEAAKKHDKVLIFAGLTAEIESEGYDRNTLSLPQSHDRLINEVLKVNKNVSVVLYGGSEMLLPWKDEVKAVLLCYLPGEAAGLSTADVLLGDVNPSGKLSETFPLSLEDTPSYKNFARDEKNVLYEESILVGYRHYDYYKKEVLFPFGYGLSYTKFDYVGAKVRVDNRRKERVSIEVEIKNIGNRDGSDVIEVYVGKKESKIFRPLRELKAFKKVFLKAGETKSVRITLTDDAFTYYSVPLNRFDIEDGDYEIYIGPSSRDFPIVESVRISGNKEPLTMSWTPGDPFEKLFKENKLPLIEEEGKLDLNSNLIDIMKNEKAKAYFAPLLESYMKGFDGVDDGMALMLQAMSMEMPLRSIAVMTGAFKVEDLKAILQTF